MTKNEAYLFGVKLATSRWREAIQSGEISPQRGQSLMQQLGWSPDRIAAGMDTGSENILKRHGYRLVRDEPMLFGAGTDPISKTVYLDPEQYSTKATGQQRQLNSLTLRHEADEALRSSKIQKRLGVSSEALMERLSKEPLDFGYMPRDVRDLRIARKYAPRLVGSQGAHMGGDVITKELRNIRLLPEAGQELLQMRKFTEIPNLLEATRAKTLEKALIPRKQVSALGKAMEHINARNTLGAAERIALKLLKTR